MEIGLYTFAETTFDAATGRQLGADRRVWDLLEEIELADQVGLDVFGVGEQRFLLQLTVGPTPHAAVLRAIELFGTRVAPAVRRATAGSGVAEEA